MILKPFMLRRIKKDVENELSDKIEVMVYCPLTTRQKLLYSGTFIFSNIRIFVAFGTSISFAALKKKIRIEDLLHYTVGGGDTASNDKNFTSNLMNLVMQFRKVLHNLSIYLILLLLFLICSISQISLCFVKAHYRFTIFYIPKKKKIYMFLFFTIENH